MLLNEAITKLEAVIASPCYCNVCKHSRVLAQRALSEAPGADALMSMDQHSPQFKVLEEKFRAAELQRLTGVLTYLARGRCTMTEQPVQGPPAPQSEIPDLPYRENSSEVLERYRKHVMKRKMRAGPHSTRIPGTFIIK